MTSSEHYRDRCPSGLNPCSDRPIVSRRSFFKSSALKTTAQLLDIYFYVPDAVAFQVVDRMDGPSARGEYVGRLGGIIRPLLEWDTEFEAKKY